MKNIDFFVKFIQKSRLFSASTENPKNAKIIAKIIIERATGEKVRNLEVTSEKSLSGITIGEHGIRMDFKQGSIWKRTNDL